MMSLTICKFMYITYRSLNESEIGSLMTAVKIRREEDEKVPGSVVSPGSSMTGLVSPLCFLSMILLYSSSSSLLTLSKGFFAYGDLNTVAWCWKSLWMMPLLAAPIWRKTFKVSKMLEQSRWNILCKASVGLLFKHFPSPSLSAVIKKLKLIKKNVGKCTDKMKI